MSIKNRAVNRIVQNSNLYQRLGGYDRKILVALLKAAYEAGRRETTEKEPTH